MTKNRFRKNKPEKSREKKTGSCPITVVYSYFNAEKFLPELFETVLAQERPPEQLLLTDAGSTDRSKLIIEEFEDKLPLRVLAVDSPRAGWTKCIEKTRTQYLVPYQPEFRWGPKFLTRLVKKLESTPEAAAAGGRVQPGHELNHLQKTIHRALTHSFGGSKFSRKPGTKKREALGNPVFRTSPLRQLDKLPEELTQETNLEVLTRLTAADWELAYDPGASLFHAPRPDWRKFIARCQARGLARGRAGRDGLFLNLRHWREDRLLLVWTFLLCWNPVGWSLLGLHLFLSAWIAVNETLEGNADPRLFFLFPMMHGAVWLGWLETRFFDPNRRAKLS